MATNRGLNRFRWPFHAYVAETHAAAIKGYIPAMRTYLEVACEAITGWSGRQSAQYPGYDRLVTAIASQTPESNLDNGYAFVGTPDEVIEQINRMRVLFGEHEPSLQVSFGGMSDEEPLRTVDLFARYIMPAFAPVTAGAV